MVWGKKKNKVANVLRSRKLNLGKARGITSFEFNTPIQPANHYKILLRILQTVFLPLEDDP